MTLPSVTTAVSRDMAHARQRVLSMYRDWLRSAPEIIKLHDLSLTTPMVRRRVRLEFEKKRQVRDLGVIDHLLFKGRTEYEETMNMWKQNAHVMQYFNEEEGLAIPRYQRADGSASFMSKFLRK
ncbi:hypothetical protein CXG81DRAFT_15681 [Caulochytrium protostelioides]|uniref:Complex 1 LYR protein domain-containing protein n=1 Tax=Caulochytrium protostelioides TaxID=1555241 RepID=A0A4P9X1C1_9FUNG|nr:hypothetical protein CXG81DRAFT_15681 [Caulochytrium protostelioides]|eukprot:RKO98618.1 hypothetical protein CXG81DRAFT_15681 [Caulochytrium protostelioides]